MDLHIVLSLSELQMPALCRILPPFETTYASACAAFRLQEIKARLGGLRILLATGDMTVSLATPTSNVVNGRSFDVVMADGQGLQTSAANLASVLSGSGLVFVLCSSQRCSHV